MIKQCKCRELIFGQNDYEKESVAVVWKKNKNEVGFVMQYQSKHRHWECRFCINQKFSRRRKSQDDRVRKYKVKEIPTKGCFIKKI